jgi:peroxiredoxin
MSLSPLELSVSQWFNTDSVVTLEQLKGRVVIVGAFQMLCPGCVAHSIPQLKKLHELSRELPLTVIGLHTVFEHHQAMQPHALQAFIHEYRLTFPVGVAAYAGNSLMPKTMEDWHMRGTPSTFVFSANGDLCLHQFGHSEDLPLGILVGQLMAAANAL